MLVRHGDQALEIDYGDPLDHISRIVATSGRFYERDLLEAILQLDVRGPYLDVGAHVGNHAVFFKRLCPSTSVLAVEPCRATYDVLVHNAARHGFSAVLAGVGVESGRAGVVVRNPLNSGMHVLGPGDDVEVMTLSFLLQAWMPALVKLDIEGQEAAVLTEAREVLAELLPVVVAEAGTDQERDAVDAALAPLRYSRGPRYCRTPTYIWSPSR